MNLLYILTVVVLAASFIANRDRTLKALRIAGRRFLRIAPAFVVMLVLVAVALYLLPENTMLRLLSPQHKWAGLAGALGIGSISVMPGFIAFPLCGVLLERGALYMVLSAFSTTLMVVGVVTFPLERGYIGAKLALARNLASLLIAATVALAMGFVFRELP